MLAGSAAVCHLNVMRYARLCHTTSASMQLRSTVLKAFWKSKLTTTRSGESCWSATERLRAWTSPSAPPRTPTPTWCRCKYSLTAGKTAARATLETTRRRVRLFFFVYKSRSKTPATASVSPRASVSPGATFGDKVLSPNVQAIRLFEPVAQLCELAAHCLITADQQ
jgi:hypothetical protein